MFSLCIRVSCHLPNDQLPPPRAWFLFTDEVFFSEPHQRNKDRCSRAVTPSSSEALRIRGLKKPCMVFTKQSSINLTSGNSPDCLNVLGRPGQKQEQEQHREPIRKLASRYKIVKRNLKFQKVCMPFVCFEPNA